MWEDLRRGHWHSHPAKCAPISLAQTRTVEVLEGGGGVFFEHVECDKLFLCISISGWREEQVEKENRGRK